MEIAEQTTGEQSAVTKTGKPHYDALDGLRGVAALMVVLYHQSETMLAGAHIQHAYLAVDFFFILSGFVISYAYTGRLSTSMSIGRFARERAIRLYPLVIMGGLIGFSYAAWFPVHPNNARPILTPAAELPFSLAAIPFPFRSISKIPFPLNIPEWSLFYEIVANAIFAFGLYRLSNCGLIIAAILFGVAHVALTFFVNDPAWSGLTASSVGSGFAQVMSEFMLGMLIQRSGISGRYRSIQLPAAVYAVCLIAVLAAPRFSRFDAVYILAATYLIFPVIVMMACQNVLAGISKRVAFTAGVISYPIYILHVPILLWLHYGLTHTALEKLPGSLKIIIATSIALGLAWLADRYYDRLLRNHLKAMYAKRQLKGAYIRE